MLYLDYSRQPGEWVPPFYAGAKTFTLSIILKRMNDGRRTGRFPGILHHRRRIHSLGQRLTSVYLGGLGFSLKLEHG